MSFYSMTEQDRRYREASRELGCICRPELPAHVHILECPMYRTAEEWLAELDEDHHAD